MLRPSRPFRRPILSLTTILLVAVPTIGFAARHAAASHAAPCTYAAEYAGMTLRCYGVPKLLSGKTAPFAVIFGASQTSDGRRHRAHIHSWSASSTTFHLDGEILAKEVACNIPLWGGACRFVYA